MRMFPNGKPFVLFSHFRIQLVPKAKGQQGYIVFWALVGKNWQKLNPIAPPGPIYELNFLEGYSNILGELIRLRYVQNQRQMRFQFREDGYKEKWSFYCGCQAEQTNTTFAYFKLLCPLELKHSS